MNNETDPGTPLSPTSLKQKLKSSLRLPWLRHHGHHHHHGTPRSASASASPLPSPCPTPSPHGGKNNNNLNNINVDKPKLTRTMSPTWLKSPEFRDKCRNLISRIGHAGHHHGNGSSHHGHGHGHGHHHHHHHHNHGRRHSADFRYDPSSYALNFDEGKNDNQLDEFPLRNFSARLPRSPPPSTAATTSSASREITAYT
ncbi:hypothetical protein COLO4_24105 [Corchorus olitorius]|uniref:Uncharacterized protein n=1 Tax=Corchorus olitorius TaxID=93759 RepID=A0A1R3ICT0_9ROSI|nr:hypothetical protein COLO4_24105 [Corchorus olitorius]